MLLNTVPTLAPQTQFIAAIGNPASSSGTNAHEWYACIHTKSRSHALCRASSQSPLIQHSLPSLWLPRLHRQSANVLTFPFPSYRGIWRVDPGPRGVRMANFPKLQAREASSCLQRCELNALIRPRRQPGEWHLPVGPSIRWARWSLSIGSSDTVAFLCAHSADAG